MVTIKAHEAKQVICMEHNEHGAEGVCKSVFLGSKHR